jgi:mannobiose 2-epimerase
MNTMLHMLEAYTNLLRIWDSAMLKKQHRAILETFRQHIIDPSTHHFKLFFDDAWNSLLEHDSYGHDIEGSWLLVEAAEVQGDPQLLADFRAEALAIAAAVQRDGLEADGSLPYEGGPHGLVNDVKAWWVQAEAVVGFYNAYQISGDERFAESAYRSWKYIEEKVVDRTHGDWFKDLHHDGTPNPASYKVGPWECPYHHARACLEMLERLETP